MEENQGVPKDAEVLGAFLLAVRIIKWPNGSVSSDVQVKNDNVPAEITLMQVKAWLNNQKNKYYEWFDNRYGSML